jgi:hypothetical protein
MKMVKHYSMSVMWSEVVGHFFDLERLEGDVDRDFYCAPALSIVRSLHLRNKLFVLLSSVNWNMSCPLGLVQVSESARGWV